MAGSRRLYSEERAARLLEGLSVGATHELACAYAGMSVDTFERWRRGNSGAPADFAELIRLAEGKAAIGWLAKIEREANNGDWRAAAWKLERRYPEQYGKQVQELHHTGKDGAPLPILAIEVARPAQEP